MHNLGAWQQPGGYQLPADVLAAVDVHAAAKALPVPQPAPLRFLEDAAAQAVDTLVRGGETPDVSALATAVADGKRQADPGRLPVRPRQRRGVGVTAADANAAFREHLARQRDRETRAATRAALAARLGLAPDAAKENGDDDPPDAAA